MSIGAEVDSMMGRLVMTVAGVQKQLTFGPNDLLSTATMLDGDKVSGKCRWFWAQLFLELDSVLVWRICM